MLIGSMTHAKHFDATLWPQFLGSIELGWWCEFLAPLSWAGFFIDRVQASEHLLAPYYTFDRVAQQTAVADVYQMAQTGPLHVASWIFALTDVHRPLPRDPSLGDHPTGRKVSPPPPRPRLCGCRCRAFRPQRRPAPYIRSGGVWWWILAAT